MSRPFRPSYDDPSTWLQADPDLRRDYGPAIDLNDHDRDLDLMFTDPDRYVDNLGRDNPWSRRYHGEREYQDDFDEMSGMMAFEEDLLGRPAERSRGMMDQAMTTGVDPRTMAGMNPMTIKGIMSPMTTLGMDPMMAMQGMDPMMGQMAGGGGMGSMGFGDRGGGGMGPGNGYGHDHGHGHGHGHGYRHGDCDRHCRRHEYRSVLTWEYEGGRDGGEWVEHQRLRVHRHPRHRHR